MANIIIVSAALNGYDKNHKVINVLEAASWNVFKTT